MYKNNSVSQHVLKPRPNDSNISTQYIPTMLAQHLQALAKRSQHLTQHIACVLPPCCNVLRHVAS